MLITKVNPMTGNENTLNINITNDQINDWQTGTLIQDAMPNITANEREFLISGMLPDGWDELFKEK